MEYVVICGVAIVVSALTLFSGFGLGTLLMPAFAVFFPISFAVAATAVVHLANNLFKVFLVGRHADIKVVTRFALPAALCAALGACLLGYFSDMTPIAHYTIGSRTCEVTIVKIMIAGLIGFFALWDLLPRFQQIAFDANISLWVGLSPGFSVVCQDCRARSGAPFSSVAVLARKLSLQRAWWPRWSWTFRVW